MEKVVVLGSNSFSGSHFVDYCLEQNMRVIGISRSDEPHEAFLPYKLRNSSDFTFHKLDLFTDLIQIMDIINQHKPDYVVNFAAQSKVSQSWENPGEWFRTNTLATILFHDKLRKCQFLKKYLHISTPEVYGKCTGIISEDTPYNPSTPFAVSRAAADMSLKTFHDVYGFPVTTTRAASIFGPGQQIYKIIPRTILFIRLGKKIQLRGGGHSVCSFIHIRDVTRGTLAACKTLKTGQVYHLSTTRHISIRELVEYICKCMDVHAGSVVETTGDRSVKDLTYLLDCAAAKEDFHWKPEITLEQGIDETIRWVDNYFNVLKQWPFDYIHKP